MPEDQKLILEDLQELLQKPENNTVQEIVQQPEPLTETITDTNTFHLDSVLFIIVCLGVVVGAVIGNAFMSQWKVGA